eukprot:jgi/Galph1/407/GphlegSOOS_G5149.1
MHKQLDDSRYKQEARTPRNSGRFSEESRTLNSIFVVEQNSPRGLSEFLSKSTEKAPYNSNIIRRKLSFLFQNMKMQISKREGWIPLNKLLIAALYSASSLGAVLVNKATLSQYNFNFPLTIVFLQLCFSVLLVSFLHATSIIELAPLSLLHFKTLFISTLFFIANAVAGLSGLGRVNIPMFSAFRRLSVLNVMTLEYFFLNKKPESSLLKAVVMMAVGSCIAGIGDLSFDLHGYLLIFLNNFLTGANLVSIKRASRDAKLDAMSLFYVTSLNALPIVTVLLLCSDELSAVYGTFLSSEIHHQSGFWLALFSTSTSAFAVNYFTCSCTQVNSALVTSVSGQMKNVLQTLVGLLMNDYQVTSLNIGGIFLALGGSIWFSYLKYLEHSNSLKMDS